MKPIYNTIGTNYNTTRRADPYIAGRLLHFLTPKPGGLYLDIGCGTGNYAIALANKGLNFVGVEPSAEMLKEARNRSEKIEWQQGIAENIPANNNSFDGTIATLTIHHWTNLLKSFKEISRVTKPGGRFVIFTATPHQMEGYWLNRYFPQMLKSAMAQMPSFDVINGALAGAGFEISESEKYFVQDDLHDRFLYAGKNKPELYLDEDVRKGISSFASLANKAEVGAGLEKLRADLASGKFEQVQKRFDNDGGDYIFIVASRSIL